MDLKDFPNPNLLLSATTTQSSLSVYFPWWWQGDQQVVGLASNFFLFFRKSPCWRTSLGAQGSIPGMSRSESAITRGKTQMMLLPPTSFSWTTSYKYSSIIICAPLVCFNANASYIYVLWDWLRLGNVWWVLIRSGKVKETLHSTTNLVITSHCDLFWKTVVDYKYLLLFIQCSYDSNSINL